MHREGKPEGFFYLDRRTVDSKHDIITDIFATPGNTNEVKPYLGRLGVQIDKFGLDVKYVGLDAGGKHFKHLQISLRHGNTGGYGTPPRLPTERKIRKVQIYPHIRMRRIYLPGA